MMDPTDHRILNELKGDGRLSVHDLSQRIGLSPSPCSRRVKLLEDKGIIKGYAAMIDEAALGFRVSIFISVKLDKQKNETLKMFEDAIRGYPEVVECWFMTGRRDYLLRVVTRDLVEFKEFLMSDLNQIPCVESLESSVPLREVKSDMVRCK